MSLEKVIYKKNTDLVKVIDMQKVPEHIAIIMDGNGRWARARALPRIAGHKEGINSVKEITKVCGEIGVKHLTLYTFSTENWKRPPSEVSALMSLLLKTIKEEISELHRKSVRFTIIGDLDAIPIKTDELNKFSLLILLKKLELSFGSSGINFNFLLFVF